MLALQRIFTKFILKIRCMYRQWLFVLLCCFLLFNACTHSKKSISRETIPTVESTLGTMEDEEGDKSASMPYMSSQKRVNDLLDTKLKVSFDWTNQTLIGEATLTLQPYFYPTQTLVLDAKGFKLEEVVLLTKSKQKKELIYKYDNRKIEITLDKKYTRQEPYTIFIKYQAMPAKLAAEAEDINYENRGLYFINSNQNKEKPQQIWTQGETAASSCWFPTIDSPNEKTTQETIITVQDKFISLSNGKLIGSTKNSDGTRTDHWKQELPHAPYLFMLAVGEYAVIKDSWRGMPVDYYVEPEYAPYAKSIFGHTPEMLEFYSKLLGYEYPWDKYAQIVVRDFVAGAMENTSATIFFEEMHMDDRELLDNNHEDIIAHELFHHWFGDVVTCESWANLALNESFATYGEYLWMEHKYGKDAADYHLYKDLKVYLREAKEKRTSIIRYYYENADKLFDRHSYQKGGRVIHMLRNYVGDEAFFLGLKKYVEEYAFKTAEIHNLRLVFEEITGEDLNWFFDQWFLKSGHPELLINQYYDEDKKQVFVNIKQTQPDETTFLLPIVIDVYHANKEKESHKVFITNRDNTFAFDASKKPALVNIDADKMLLCEKTETKSTEEYVHQYHNAPLFLDRYEAIKALNNQQETNSAVVETFRKGLADPFWLIRKLAAKNILLTNDTLAATVAEELVELCKDGKPQVRVEAINKLSEYKDPKFLPLFVQGIKDSSYLVATASLHHLHLLYPSKALEEAKYLEQVDNSSLTNIIAKIYSEKGTIEKQAFFENKLRHVKTYDRYSLIDYYGDFLNRTGDATLTVGLQTLQWIAVEDKNWWIRLNATQAISELQKLYLTKRKELELKIVSPGIEGDVKQEMEKLASYIFTIDQIIKVIKEQEKNPKVNRYYDSL